MLSQRFFYHVPFYLFFYITWYLLMLVFGTDRVSVVYVIVSSVRQLPPWMLVFLFTIGLSKTFYHCSLSPCRDDPCRVPVSVLRSVLQAAVAVWENLPQAQRRQDRTSHTQGKSHGHGRELKAIVLFAGKMYLDTPFTVVVSQKHLLWNLCLSKAA